MSLQQLERETTIIYNDAERTATVYTCNSFLQQKLKKIALQFPTQFKLLDETAYAVIYEVPKNCILIRSPYKDEYREKARLRAYEQKLGHKKNS